MSDHQAVAVSSPLPFVRKTFVPARGGNARKPHQNARNFRFPGRAAKGATVGQSDADKALIANFIRDKGVTVLPAGHAFGAKSMPTYEQFAAPAY